MAAASRLLVKPYADVVDTDYLAPRDFSGTTQIVTTPEALYPFLGPFTETFDDSEAQGQQILDTAILNQIAGGNVNAANPVDVFGYSQSSVISSLLMPELASQDVPSDDVHFVLVGDESAPNGGILERFDLPAGTQPTIPSLGLTFSGPEASDLYPTDVYTNEYDGFADFPQYPIDPLSDLNAVLGIAFQHTTYLGLTPEQIQDAIQLPTTAADTLTNYYMIPDSTLPLLDPLQLIPFIGQPLVDLLNPDLSVLVNLGYGDVADNYLGGWSQGDADVPTTLGFLPSSSVLEQVPQALVNGLAARDHRCPQGFNQSEQLRVLVAILGRRTCDVRRRSPRYRVFSPLTGTHDPAGSFRYLPTPHRHPASGRSHRVVGQPSRNRLQRLHVRPRGRRPNGRYRHPDRRRPGNITSGANRSSALAVALSVQQLDDDCFSNRGLVINSSSAV